MRTTLKDVARACGVDVATASRALSNSYGVHKATRQKILAAAAQLNYRRNGVAKGLVTGRSQTIALILSDIRNPFFAEVARGAEDAAQRANYELILCNSDLDPEKQMRYIHSLLEKRVEGILMNSVGDLSEIERDELHQSGVPFVLLNRPPVRSRGFSTVLADNYEGGYLAGSYLVRLGHQSIVQLTGSRHHGNLAERGRGFAKALQEAGAKISSLTLRGQHNTEGAYQMMKSLLGERRDFTAVFTANDAMAFGAIRAIFEVGLKVPDDISVIGFDNVELAGITRPPLTTVHQPKYEMGWAAVDVLLSHAGCSANWTPEHRVLEVKLVERESCRAIPGSDGGR